MTNGKNNGANLGFENKLWGMTDKIRGHMDADELRVLSVEKLVDGLNLNGVHNG